MKTLFCSVVTSALLFTFSARAEDKPAPGTQTAQAVEVTGDKDGKTTIHYWLALPPASETKPAGGYPLMIFMHGSGERGDNLQQVKQHGPPKLVGTKPELNKFIIVSPQCPSTRWWDLVALKGLIDHALKTQPVDKDRVILTGLSMGGFSTWGLLAAYPDLAAAAVPICGGGDPTKAEKFKNVPIHVYHGANDSAVPFKKSEEMVEALKKAGGKPEFTIYPVAGHDCWTETYADAKLYAWMLEQKRPAK